MDIKLKKSNKKTVVIILAFIICVSSFTAGLSIGLMETMNMERSNQNVIALLDSEDYWESGLLQEDFARVGNTLLDWAKTNDPYYSEALKMMEEEGLSYFISDGKQTKQSENFSWIVEASKSTPEQLEAMGIEQGAYRLYSESKLTGSPEIVKQNAYSGDGWLIHYLDNYSDEQVSEELNTDSGFNLSDKDAIVYMAFSEEYISQQTGSFVGAREEVIGALYTVGICLLLCIVSLVVLCVLCGKKDELGNPVLTGIDRWFTEPLLGLVMGALFCGAFWALNIISNRIYGYYRMEDYGFTSYYDSSSIYSTFDIIAMAVGVWIIAALGLLFLLSLVKKIKARRFFGDFFIVKMVLWVWSGLKDIYYGSSVMKKVIITVFLMCLCSASVVFFPVVVVVALIFASKWVKQYEEIKKGVDLVKNGNPAYKIPILGDGKGELESLASDINAISTGFDVAVRQELKNQRMKTELISNVSHDIKTPLTSIITYVDLLKKEGLDCEEAPKYLDVLDQKSIRLKKLTEDLFEAAKASSGDIPVHMEKVELLSLLSQTMGEMDDRLEEKGLEVIIKSDTDKKYVEADGQLMWRVMENLFGNAIKYALSNSRVYVNIYEEERLPGKGKMVVLEMKNISQNSLNIPAEELMERFKRGDESRTTEGSGLGLSIAKDLVSMQNGQFELVIDGDLFKAIIALEIYQ